MTKVNVLNISGQVVGDIELNDDIFQVEINEHAVYEVVKNHLANKRQGTQSAKTRAEVKGGGKKPWRQKGTGRARAGSSRSPIWRKGGVVFAPKPRDYSYVLPKKVKRLALKSVLTSKVNEEEIIVLEDLNMESVSTKKAFEALTAIQAKGKVLVVYGDSDNNCFKSFRNIDKVNVSSANNINVYDVINSDSLVITKEAIGRIEEVYA